MTRVPVGPLSIDAPQGWTLSTVILSGPPDPPVMDSPLLWAKQSKPFQRNLVATIEQVETTETAETYVNRQIAGLNAAGVRRLEARGPETVELAGGRTGLLTEQIVIGANGERVRQMQIVAIKDGCAYTLITSHLDGPPFEAARAEFRSILLSFR